MARKGSKIDNNIQEEIIQKDVIVVEENAEIETAEVPAIFQLSLEEQLALAEIEFEKSIEIMAKRQLGNLIEDILDKKEERDRLFHLVYFGNKEAELTRVKVESFKKEQGFVPKITQGRRLDIFKSINNIYDKIVRMSR